jgi:endo-1,4-beta-xylanase
MTDRRQTGQYLFTKTKTITPLRALDTHFSNDMKLHPFLAAIMISLPAWAAELPLWPGDAPGSEGKTEAEIVVTSPGGERSVSSIHHPSITPFLPAPEKATGAAILVIPGGGHSKLCVDHEGCNIAQWLADHGIAAFVLKHRLAREKGSTYTIEQHAMDDTRRAMRTIRSRAAEWKIDPAKLGAMGFSAGGELVAQASQKADNSDPAAKDPIDQKDARPSFQILIYPGRSDDILPEKDAPPAFLACGENDRKDIAQGLPEAYLRFKRAGASAELHVYANTGHGFGMRASNKGPAAAWPDDLAKWMLAKGFLSH